MTRIVFRLSALLLALALAACGGGTSGGGSEESEAAATTSERATTDDTVSDEATPSEADKATEEPSDGPTTEEPTEEETAGSEATEAAAELPGFMSDFDRVCNTQVGYTGATSFVAAAPGVAPIVLLEEYQDGGDYIESARQLPAGWTVEQDSNYEDNSELKAIQLVGCLEQLTATPNGTMCEFDSEGTKVNLELVDGTFELRVYAATTGEQVGAVPLEAKGTECPMFATFREGDTTYFNTIDDDQVINAIKTFVEP